MTDNNNQFSLIHNSSPADFYKSLLESSSNDTKAKSNTKPSFEKKSNLLSSKTNTANSTDSLITGSESSQIDPSFAALQLLNEEYSYCSNCEIFIQKDQFPFHLQAISHLFSSTKKIEQSLQQDNVGYKILKKLGWKDGSGLGKQLDGIKVPIKSVKKRDRAGIGLSRQPISTTATTTSPQL
ncbi:hypothetical protein BB560_006239 [Smittium megazygosporum]|uniref:G-patch domain-containing protein n=1 Tax=Smittium megazygosporum TaxID=133381 RepID=A0A2T9YCN3_9FUNG|nr:hypothetical protein BB560_006239 [Smittium megazygosporum]